MNKKFIKYFLVPGALGLTLVWHVQSSYASENNGQTQATIYEPSQNQAGENSKNNQAAPASNTVLTNNPASTTEVKNKFGEQNDTNKGNDTNQKTEPGQASQVKDPKKENKDKKLVIKELPNEDENHNKNYQDHPIKNESTDKYEFKKGEELSKEEIDKEFAKYKENASQFAKIQEWIPKLKEINHLGLQDGEKSNFYKTEVGGKTFLSTKGFKFYKSSRTKELFAEDLADHKLYRLSDNYDNSESPVVENIIGSGSDYIKNYQSDQRNILYNSTQYKGGDKTVKVSGSYAKKIANPDGSVSYEYYEGDEAKKKEDLEKVKKILNENSSALLEQLGAKHFDKLVDRAYQAALVNSYLVKNNKDMTEEDRKNIVEYVYRFGLNYKSDESLISKSENNGYVDVSPIGYAEKTDKGTYKYKYQLSFNSITSNDKYSSTRLDIYAPTMAKNLKFTLTSLQEYEKKDDGTYIYKNKNVDVELKIANTKDPELRKLLDKDAKTIKEPEKNLRKDGVHHLYQAVRVILKLNQRK